MTSLRRSWGVTLCLCAPLLWSFLPAALSDEITFEDQRGKPITLAEPADNVVALPKPVPPMFIGVDGGTERLKGMHPAAQAVGLNGFAEGVAACAGSHP